MLLDKREIPVIFKNLFLIPRYGHGYVSKMGYKVEIFGEIRLKYVVMSNVSEFPWRVVDKVVTG